MVECIGPIDMKTTLFCFKHQGLRADVIFETKRPRHIPQASEPLLDRFAVKWIAQQRRLDRRQLCQQQLV